MTKKLEPSEAEALDKSGGLLRYAAENRDLDQAIVSPICAAWEARESETWNQEIAVNFWLAFNKLCSLIKPVTMDTMSTNLKEFSPSRLAFWKKGPVSLSQRTANRYSLLLALLLAAAIVLTYVLAQVKEIKDQLDTADQLAAKLSLNTEKLGARGLYELSNVGANDQLAVSEVKAQFRQLNFLQQVIAWKTYYISLFITLGRKRLDYVSGTNEDIKNLAQLKLGLQAFVVNSAILRSYIVTDSWITEMISTSILPIILGLMGACSFVVRYISDQIKNTTFSTTSSIRHQVRILLGALAGVVIGYGGIGPTGGLSSAALSFIAGYSIEPVFAMLDSISQRFRQ